MSFWDYLGKLFRRGTYIPPECGICENCGKIVLKQDLHRVRVLETNEELLICDDCSDLPPSTWRRRHVRE